MTQQPSLPANSKTRARKSRLGLPEFKWTMTLFGLTMYSFAIITFFIPVAQVGVAIGVAGLFMGKSRMRMPAPFFLFLTFLIWALIASFAVPFPDVAMNTVTERLKLPIIMLMTLNAFQTGEQLRFYLLFVLVCFILFPARGTFIGGNSISGGRVVWTGIYENPNDLAALCLLAFGCAVAFFFSGDGWNYARIGAIGGAGILLVVILRTQSRGVFLGVLVATGPAFFSMLIKDLRRAVVIAIVVALVLVFAVPAKTWNRILGVTKLTAGASSVENMGQSAGASESESSSAERLQILKTAWKIYVDNPVFGIGMGAFPLACDRYAPELGKRDTHNTYLNLASETGLPGLLLWCSLTATVLLHAFGTRRRVKESSMKTLNFWLGQTIIGYLVAGIFGSFSGLNFPYIMLSLLWSSSVLIQNENQPIKRRR